MGDARISVRRGGASDMPFIEALGKRTVMHSVARFRTPIRAMVDLSFERLLAYIGSQSHVIFICERASAPIGFLLLLDAMPDEVTLMPQAFVAYMAVDEPARRAGAGRALLLEAERYARDAHLPTLSMMVTEDNAPARALYDSLGFFTERRHLTKELT